MAAIISSDYLRMQQELHRNPHYGVASLHYASLVKKVIEIGHIRSLSDYGAGKTRLQRRLQELGSADFEYYPYDPAFPEYGPPMPADLVCCIDVLEHVEPEMLDAVLDELAKITKTFGFFTIHCGPAQKILSDGRNAHLIQQPSSWWLPKLNERFDVHHLRAVKKQFWVIVGPKGAQAAVFTPEHIRELELAERENLAAHSLGGRLLGKAGVMRLGRRIAKRILTPAQYEFLRDRLK